MSFLEPRLVQIQNFTVAGISTRTNNQNEFDLKTAKLPTLWNKFYAQDIPSQFSSYKLNPSIFGVYSDYESDVTGSYTVTAGLEISDEMPPPQFTTIAVQSGNYLLFENQGPQPQTIIQTWQQVWDYFSSQSQFTRKYDTDFEVYRNSHECAVYIGITK
ncbi:GyrI-like domain-containing protein [Legionella cardiaca]|uniref:GyrI-like domain-containing protein n=1 Tax=Legionella cardiaca TaxID=1071983 RepID=A0ABY8AV51_9GAMM|nr:GyrI-like domain-containing protein [Legionella cardiaca]WED44569.1 GyrI-like domain-containing protein [Legionella cardiaca]